jgi:hypothetical protein
MRQHVLRGASAAISSVLLFAVAGAPASAADLPLRAKGASGPLGNERLSDEKTITRFVRPNRRATVRRAPSYAARGITKLHFYTEDQYPEVYIALQTRRIEGESWIQLRIPGRPNGRKGWVPKWAIQPFRMVHTRLEVSRRTLRATLYKHGKRIWTSRVGVGKASTPTPSGHYWIRERARFGSASGVYGPWAFGTSAYSRLSEWPRGGVVGIHGTNQPSLIPGRPSNGCIRVPNHKILQLAKLLPVGTPLIIT